MLVLLPMFTIVVFSYARNESKLKSGGTRARIPTSYTPAGTGYAACDESTVTLPEVYYEFNYPPPGSPPPFDKGLPAYTGSSEEDKKDAESLRTVVGEDPFTDFEGHPRIKVVR
jgi:hypothetical protein